MKSQDFTMLGSVVNYTNVLLIGPQIPAKTVAELVAFAKANPEKVSFGSAGFGGSNHLSAELLVQSTNTTMLHVPYKGNSPAMMDVISGKITFMFDITSTGKVFVDSVEDANSSIVNIVQGSVQPGLKIEPGDTVIAFPIY